MEEWILAIERFCRLSDGDVPYWYNERANVGVLSAAAWRAGAVALEEFQHEKIDIENFESKTADKDAKWNGRCDLWISDGKRSERVEAKFRWLNMTSDRIAEFAEVSLKQAVSDASNSKSDDGQAAVGVAFLPLSVKASKVTDEKTIELYIEETIATLRKVDADLIAWCFPIRLRDYIGEQYGYQLPGVVMLAKRVG